jgi:hypothetical protein
MYHCAKNPKNQFLLKNSEKDANVKCFLSTVKWASELFALISAPADIKRAKCTKALLVCDIIALNI